MNHEPSVFKEEFKHIDNFQERARIDERNNRDPFIDFSHHLHWLWLELGFYFSLEIREKTISKK
jgi:hypothetical protein